MENGIEKEIVLLSGCGSVVYIYISSSSFSFSSFFWMCGRFKCEIHVFMTYVIVFVCILINILPVIEFYRFFRLFLTMVDFNVFRKWTKKKKNFRRPIEDHCGNSLKRKFISFRNNLFSLKKFLFFCSAVVFYSFYIRFLFGRFVLLLFYRFNFILAFAFLCEIENSCSAIRAK